MAAQRASPANSTPGGPDIRDAYLPTTRPRPLTPPPGGPSPAPAIASSPLFKLPYELRRQILTEAFGDRIVHMDLRFDHPYGEDTSEEAARRLPPPWETDIGHCGRKSIFNDRTTSWQFERDVSQPKRWIWHGSMCHSRPDRGYERVGNPRHRWVPVTDTCLRPGATSLCARLVGVVPEGCFLGIMGWLLSCRQAYAEAIDVLYSTNIIYITDNATLVCHLPHLLPRHRVDSITTLELCFNADFEDTAHPPSDAPPDPETRPCEEAFEAAIAAIPNTFPGLKRLIIDMRGNWYPFVAYWREIIAYWNDRILTPVSDMAEKIPRLEECILLIPRYVFRLLVEEGTRPRHTRSWGRVWVPGHVDKGVWRPFRTTAPNKVRRGLRDFRDGVWIATAGRNDGNLCTRGDTPWMDDWGCVDDVRLHVDGYVVSEGPEESPIWKRAV